MKLNINLTKLYYKYINISEVNHYKLLILAEEYKNIGEKYFKKYPNAKGWINLDKELFDSNKNAKIDFNTISKRQSEIKKEFFENREIICKKCENEKYIICSDNFEKFYVKQDYHYGESIDNIIKNIITDINNK
jgi:hypothetical protein